MRTLHPVHASEKKVCEGKYRYFMDDRSTGQAEEWLITRLPNGTEVTRCDLSGGKAIDKLDVICQFARNEDNRPQWLRVRFETPKWSAASQYMFEDAVVKAVRRTDGEFGMQDRMDIADDYELDCYLALLHDFSVRGYPERAEGNEWSIPVFRPLIDSNDPRDLLEPDTVRHRTVPVAAEEFESTAGTFPAAQRFDTTLFGGEKVQCWFDEYGIPLRLYYPESKLDIVLVSYGRYSD